MEDPRGAARRAPRYGFFVALGVALVVGLGGLFHALRLRAPHRDERPHEQAELDTSDYLRPIETTRDAVTGERAAAFSGFAVSIETDPPDALVTVAGAPRGESPVLADVACAPGERVEIEVRKAGFRTERRATACRRDALVKLEVRLAPR